MVEATQEKRRAVVLVIDRLGAGYLGPFGNTWIDTPCFNQLASQSLLVDQAWIDSPQLHSLYRTLWQGGHAAFEHSQGDRCLSEIIRAAGHPSCLITDEPEVAEHPLHTGFDQVEVVVTADGVKKEIEDTNVARLFSFAEQAIENQEHDLIWIHSQGMQGCWDAPLELRDYYVEEDDPEPPRGDARPNQQLPLDFDRDELQAWIWAYAGQVAMIDACLSMLLQTLDRTQSSTLFVLMGARGYPLGEHRIIGEAGLSLHSELLHVPLLMRVPGQATHSVRCQQLVQPGMLHQTLNEWFRVDGSWSHSLLRLLESPGLPWPQQAITQDHLQWMIHTPTWLARLDDSEAETDWQLYLKPDDYWDFNDVSDRCSDVVVQFQQLLRQVRAVSSHADWQRLEPLNELLLTALS
ncbi:MAG: sulfatase-like hydrolase/transferase [Planctomycetaceae bacterium]|nr:sulfatase-like hydrolase/transferase [Planctomycetaceae bacterium]